MIYDFAGGRKFNPGERLLFSAATFDEGMARVTEAFGSRSIGPARMLLTGAPRALAAHARRLVSRRARGPARPLAVSAGAPGEVSRGRR
jgi:hypothetical protein